MKRPPKFHEAKLSTVTPMIILLYIFIAIIGLLLLYVMTDSLIISGFIVAVVIGIFSGLRESDTNKTGKRSFRRNVNAHRRKKSRSNDHDLLEMTTVDDFLDDDN